MSALLIRRRRPIGERTRPVGRRPAPSSVIPAAATILDGTAGAGRICAALLTLGVELAAVRQAVIDVDAPLGDLDRVDLRANFDRVVLGSHLVNAPDEERRTAFVRLAARHLAPGGALLLEHHPLDWAGTAADVPATPGGAPGMVDVRRDPPFVSAVSVFDAGGRVVRQPFTARVLSDAELSDLLRGFGLEARRRLGPTWLEAGRPTIPT